jgi:phage FluMu protein Com
MEAHKECPKCKGPMDEGFVPDHGHHHTVLTAKWQEGAPERSFWRGIKIDDQTQYEIKSYRCRKCGYLESYAH